VKRAKKSREQQYDVHKGLARRLEGCWRHRVRGKKAALKTRKKKAVKKIKGGFWGFFCGGRTQTKRQEKEEKPGTKTLPKGKRGEPKKGRDQGLRDIVTLGGKVKKKEAPAGGGGEGWWGDIGKTAFQDTKKEAGGYN